MEGSESGSGAGSGPWQLRIRILEARKLRDRIRNSGTTYGRIRFASRFIWDSFGTHEWFITVQFWIFYVFALVVFFMWISVEGSRRIVGVIVSWFEVLFLFCFQSARLWQPIWKSQLNRLMPRSFFCQLKRSVPQKSFRTPAVQPQRKDGYVTRG